MNRKLLLVFCVLALGLATNALAQLPAGQDVGGPALAGSFSYDAGTDSWTVIGCGADIWGGWDQFHYVFRPLAGDGSGVVRVVSMDVTHEWAKVGVMIRETLAGNSKHMMISMTGTHGVQTVWREQTGGASADVTSDIALPIYLKVERIGNTFNTYMTFNPLFWIPQHSVTIDMKPNVTIGMFVCSTDSALLNTTVFDNVDLVAPAFLTAWAVSPADGILADLAGETISWMPGDTADSHNVHFGTTSPPPLIGNQAETTYDTGPLEGGVTYFYRIDEVEADGTTVHAGEERSMYTMRPGTGSITREVWEGIGGVAVSDLTNNAAYPDDPSWSDELPKMDSSDFGDNYGGRLIGLLAPETSGDYTFWILSDDASELWLSTTGKGCDAELIAYITGCCGNYDTDLERKSDPIYLEGGQTYPIWALWKEGGGGDYCRVAWEGPDAPSRTEIDGYYLMPGFADIAASNPSPADGATGVDISPTLSWKPALDAVSYEVYVDDALVASTADTSAPAGPFDLATSHTWRVDVINPAGTVTGCVWSFTVSDNRVIDDFESYDVAPEAIAPQMVVDGDYTIAAVAPPAQEFIGGDYTIPGYTEVEAVAPDDTGLAAHYEFENDTTDSSGNGHDGTYDGVPVFVPGAPDGPNPAGAIQFDGQGPQRVEVLPFDVVGSGITIACWFKASNLDTPGNDPRMISKTAGGNNDEHWFMISSSRVGDDKVLRFRLKTDDGTTSELKADSPGGIIPLDVWTHMTATWDGSMMRLYKDGVEVGSTAKVGTAVATNPDLPLSIGNQPSTTDARPWDGLIDDVRIYNYGLSEGEARHLAGVGDLVIDPVYVPPTYGPMRLHLEFEGDANDSSSNGNDGTLMGDAQFEAGPIGQALLLDGDGDYVNVDGYKGINAVDGVQQPFSVANWFRIAPGASDGNVEMVTWGTSAGRQRLTWRVHQGRLRTEHAAGNLRGNTYVDDDEWHHGALVVTEGANLRVPNTLLYVDGVQDSTFSGSDNTYNLVPGADVRIGMSGPQNGRYWPGSIDDVRIYDYTLSEGEVRYLAGVGDKYIPPIYGPLRLHMEFEGDLTDGSGNGNDGTAVGAIAFETDPVMGQVVSLPGGDDQYVAVPPVGLSGNDPTTIACWAKADHTNIPDWSLIFGFTGNADGGGGCGSHFNISSIGGPGGIGAHAWCWERTILSDQEGLEWHHYAMTYDGTAITYYGDATAVGTENVDLSSRADRVHVGSRITQTSSFPGKVDDARVYDYALTDGQIAGLAGKTPDNPISDTWSDWGLVDFILSAGTMRLDTYGWPGMPYYVGEVSRTPPFADLTEGGGKALSTWVKGDSANVAALMYMSLTDGDGQSANVLYDGDLTDAEWQEWNVDMADLAPVDVTNASDIAIGLAGLDGGVAGDIMNVDNIRVYTGRCMPDVIKPAADLNDDCVVDVEDLMILADAWGATTLTCTITANGNDIWGNSDNFHYMYKELSGDGEIQARVVSIGGPSGNTWRKAGVMIRETLDGDSKHVASSMTPGNGKSLHWRDATGGGSGHNSTGGYVAPYWVKLVRTGNEFVGYMSPDGVDWVQQGDPLTIEMADPIHIGLSLTSHESGLMSTSTYDNVSINGEIATDLVGVDVGTPLPGSSECAMILSVADLNQDENVGWMDVILMLGEWLDEELWP